MMNTFKNVDMHDVVSSRYIPGLIYTITDMLIYNMFKKGFCPVVSRCEWLHKTKIRKRPLISCGNTNSSHPPVKGLCGIRRNTSRRDPPSMPRLIVSASITRSSNTQQSNLI